MEWIGHYLILLSVFTVVYSDCDPGTEYSKDGMCCAMCKQGYRMSSSNTGCIDPQCMPCLENEYQPGYTKETRCKLQPYCDPNKNFELKSVKSKTSLSQCVCKSGHHCFKEECMTCVPHTKCGLGLGVLYEGNHTHDTVCQACPVDTFSSENSAESKCMRWKDCGSGFIEGTPTSDTICVGLSPGAKGAIIVAVVGALIVACVAIVWNIKGKHGQADIGREGKRCCVQWCLPDNKTVVDLVGHHEDARLMIPDPEKEDKQPEHEDARVMVPEVGQLQQPDTIQIQDISSIPEETEDTTQAQGTTENGQLVKQEEFHTSKPESEMGFFSASSIL